MHLARHKLLVACAAVVLLGLGALVGCTMVGDHLSGIDLRGAGPTTCIKDCNNSYKLLYQEEQKRHIAAVEACQTLSQPDKATCLDAETLLHQSNKDALSQGKIDCQNNCHRQGSGRAG